MSLYEFVRVNNLKPTDGIKLRKKVLGMLSHYAIFYCYRNNKPVFVANFRDGVKELDDNFVRDKLSEYDIEKIIPFPHNEKERVNAFARLESRLGEMAYDLFFNNCEHLLNYVHHGNNFSNQVDNLGNMTMVSGGALALSGIVKEKPAIAILGLASFMIGALLKDAANGYKDSSKFDTGII